MRLQKTDVAAIGLIAAGALGAHEVTAFLLQSPATATISVQREAADPVLRPRASPRPPLPPPAPRLGPDRARRHVHFAPWPPPALAEDPAFRSWSQTMREHERELERQREWEQERKRKRRRRPPRR